MSCRARRARRAVRGQRGRSSGLPIATAYFVRLTLEAVWGCGGRLGDDGGGPERSVTRRLTGEVEAVVAVGVDVLVRQRRDPFNCWLRSRRRRRAVGRGRAWCRRCSRR